jgi:5-carboxymethyl-2-hydroxymuconate isomerase
MKNSKLYKLYHLLDKKEKKKFDRWLKYELNGKKTRLFILKEGLDRGWERAVVWDKLFPGKKYNDTTMRDQMKLLNGFVEEFLAISFFRSSSEYRDFFLAAEVANRKAPNLFTIVYKKASRRLDAEEIRDDKYYRFRYEYDLLYNQIANQFNYKDSKSPEELIQGVNDSFDIMMILSKLKMGIMNTSQQARNRKLDTRLIDAICEEIERDSDLSGVDAIKLYLSAYQVAKDGKDADGEALRNYIKDYGKILNPEIYKVIFSILLNFYIRKLNTEREKAPFKIIFEIYLEGIERDILTIKGVVDPRHVSNVVRAGIQAKEYKKIRERLRDLVAKVPPHLQEEIWVFNKACILFAEKDFKACADLMRQKGNAFENGLLEVRSRIMILQCWYETDIPIEVTDIYNVFRILSRRDEISQSKREVFHNTLQFFRELIVAFSTESYLRLKTEIEAQSMAIERPWFLEKIEAKISR